MLFSNKTKTHPYCNQKWTISELYSQIDTNLVRPKRSHLPIARNQMNLTGIVTQHQVIISTCCCSYFTLLFKNKLNHKIIRYLHIKLTVSAVATLPPSTWGFKSKKLNLRHCKKKWLRKMLLVCKNKMFTSRKAIFVGRENPS